MHTPERAGKKRLHVGADKIRTLDVSEGSEGEASLLRRADAGPDDPEYLQPVGPRQVPPQQG